MVKPIKMEIKKKIVQGKIKYIIILSVLVITVYYFMPTIGEVIISLISE